jgi:chaperone modulatory protein CbpM
VSSSATSNVHVVIVESEVHFSLAELGRACDADVTLITALVHEGVLTPLGEDPSQWRFAGATLPRARKAVRVMRDLELSAPGVALVLDLIGEIDALRAELKVLRG